jgi:hypothetical protein
VATGGVAVMTEDELSWIERRADAASPGEWLDGWDYDENEGHFILAKTDDGELFSLAEALPVDIFNPCLQVEAKRLRANAEFIAAARTDIPALAYEVRRLRAELAAQKNIVRGAVAYGHALQIGNGQTVTETLEQLLTALRKYGESV